MKKLFLTLSLCVFTSVFAQARQVYANDYLFQKQIIISNNYSCQAVRIHKNWLLTAGHCVAPYMYEPACSIRLIVAQGREAKASVVKDCDEVYVPTEMTEGKAKELLWDIALIRFPLAEEDTYEYHDQEGNTLFESEFKEACSKDALLRAQWKERDKQFFPQLYTYEGKSGKDEEAGKFLRNALLVPFWRNGIMTYLSSAQRVLYLGKIKQKDEKTQAERIYDSLWVTIGFGVDHGNSGGAVLASHSSRKPAMIGVVSAKEYNNGTLPEEAKKYLPDFAQAKEFFIFTGFGPKTTVKFIVDTLRRFDDNIKFKKISRVIDYENPEAETQFIRVE